MHIADILILSASYIFGGLAGLFITIVALVFGSMLMEILRRTK